MFISPSFTRMVQAADTASLLTASGMLLQAFPRISIYMYMYLILAKMTKHFGINQLFPLLKYMINMGSRADIMTWLIKGTI